MRTTLVTLMCSALASLACASAFGATTVYKWVDEKGVTHYSDQPHPDAKMVELQSAQTFQSRGASASSPPTSDAESNRAVPYTRCILSRPENDEVFLNTFTVAARLTLTPALRAGDRVTIGLDGKNIANAPAAGGDFVLTDLPRGTHTLTAVVQDSRGTTVCTSPTVTFHVRQPSKQAPNPANRPRF